MQIDKIIEISMLFDFYGQLLTDKQREIYSLYHEDNLSLGEIALEVGISRQGVHETLKKSEKLLHQYDEKLNLIEKFSKKEEVIQNLDKNIEEMIRDNPNSQQLTKKLIKMKKIIDGLNE